MKTMLKCAVFLGIWCAAAAIPVFAQDTLNRDTMVIGEQEIGVSGTVTDIGFDRFTIQSGANNIVISTEELDLDNSLNELIREGMRVEVQGDLADSRSPDPTIEAQQIRVVGYAGGGQGLFSQPQQFQQFQQPQPLQQPPRAVPLENQDRQPLFVPGN